MALALPLTSCYIFDFENKKRHKLISFSKYCFYLVLLFLSITCISQKINCSFSWWGTNDDSLYAKTETTDIKALSGVKLSLKQKELYESITSVVLENTSYDDVIWSYPHIKIFNVLTDNYNLDTFAPIVFYDVSADKYIEKETELLKHNLPKIIIWEDIEGCKETHEELFRDGEPLKQRDMEDMIYNNLDKYKIIKRIDNFTVYCLDDEDNYKSFVGEGTESSPYLIQSVSDLQLLQKNVANGQEYIDKYFKQTNDIDCSSVDNWTPIGEFGTSIYFKGIYDGNGHTISNLRCISDENVGLFGQLGGTICNLGIIDSEFTGAYLGVFSSHAVNSSATIINCYSYNNVVNGNRAGGIADNFIGNIVNCVSDSTCNGSEMVGSISYVNGYVENVYSSIDNVNSKELSYGNQNVTYLTSEQLNSTDVLNKLNTYVDAKKYDSKVKLVRWSIDNDKNIVVLNN